MESRFDARHRRSQAGYPDRMEWEGEDFNQPAYWIYEDYWLIPGPFSGIGPRGYQRSDERIHEEVCDRLTSHGQIDARDMEIGVENGEVTLRGRANSRREKRMAEDIAESVAGVRDIHNELRIPHGDQNLEAQPDVREADRAQGGTQQPGAPQSGGPQGGVQQVSPAQPERQGLGQIRPGMQVVGARGQHIGTVKEVRQNDFLLDRTLARDLYVPFSACKSVAGQVMLNTSADQVDKQGWTAPQRLDSSQSQAPK